LVETAQAAGNDQLFATLVQLAPSFDTLQKAMQQLGQGVESTTDNILENALELEKVASESVKNAFDDLKEALENELNVELERLEKNLNATVAAIDLNLETITKGFLSSIEEIKNSISDLSTASNQTDFAFGKLQESLAAERDAKILAYEQQYKDQKSAIENQIEVQQGLESAASNAVDSLSSLFDTLQDGINSLYDAIDSTANVNKALAFINQALMTARAGGGLPKSEQISGAISTAAGGLTSERFGSAFEMQKANMVLQNQLMELQGYTATELTISEKQLQSAQQQIDLLDRQLQQLELQHQENLELAGEQYEEQLEFYQLQIDALRGVDNSVLTVDASVMALNTAMVSEQQAMYALQSLIGNQQYANQVQLIGFANSQVELINIQIEQAKELHAQQLETATSQYEQEVADAQAKHDETLQYYQQQVDALFGINNSVKSVEEAIRQLIGSMSQMQSASSAAAAAAGGSAVSSAAEKEKSIADIYDSVLNRIPDKSEIGYWVSTGDSLAKIASDIKLSPEYRMQEVTRFYDDILGRIPDPKGLDYWVKSSDSLDKIAEIIAASPEAKGLSAFANGGYYPGGMAMVGERGPELIDFSNPGQVYSNERLRSAMGGDDVATEIRGLREENRIQSRAMVSMQSRMTRMIERWDGDGLPTERYEDATA